MHRSGSVSSWPALLTVTEEEDCMLKLVLVKQGYTEIAFSPPKHTEFCGYTMDCAISVTGKVRGRYWPSLRHDVIGANKDQLLGLDMGTMYFDATFFFIFVQAARIS